MLKPTIASLFNITFHIEKLIEMVVVNSFLGTKVTIPGRQRILTGKNSWTQCFKNVLLSKIWKMKFPPKIFHLI